MRYVALLRGINVGGRVIKMTELKACFEKAGFKNVTTLLQTGNVVFDASGSAAGLKDKIESQLTKAFNYPAKVQVVTLEDLKKIVVANPFGGAPAGYQQYVIFFENGLEKEFAAEPQESKGEMTQAGDGVAYWKAKKGMTLQSSRGRLLSKQKHKNFNTNRNVNTLQKILEL